MVIIPSFFLQFIRKLTSSGIGRITIATSVATMIPPDAKAKAFTFKH
jgi:hypothetical protein